MARPSDVSNTPVAPGGWRIPLNPACSSRTCPTQIRAGPASNATDRFTFHRAPSSAVSHTAIPHRPPVSDALASSLALLIERMFRYTWFLATEKRNAMVREGREDEVNALVAEGRGLHDKLRRGTSE